MKLGKILFAIVTLLCLTAVFAACNYVHEHDWAMRSDSAEHWQECFDDKTEKEGSRAPHIDADNDEICDECGFVMTTGDGNPDHQHNFSDNWSSDATNHWKQCTSCTEKTELSPHVDGDGDGLCDECLYNMKGGTLLDSRSFWIVGNFAPSNWATDYRDELKFTRQSELDANGNTVYVFEFTFAAGDKFKVVNDGGNEYYDGELNATHLTANALQYFQSQGEHQNIELKGAPGRYRIIVRTNGDIAEVDAEPLQ